MVEILEQISDRVIEGNVSETEGLTKKALEQGIDTQKIINEGFLPGLEVVGKKYETGEFFLPEMLVAGMAATAGIKLLRPLMARSGTKPAGTIVAGTVEGDMHDIGKNLVCLMCQASGFEVVDLGTDVPAHKFIASAKENGGDIIVMSALLSSTRANMPGIIEAIRESELGHKIKVMVGGAALTEDYANSIGADGYAPDASLAAKKARELLGVRSNLQDLT